jgi:hypothetical protein
MSAFWRLLLEKDFFFSPRKEKFPLEKTLQILSSARANNKNTRTRTDKTQIGERRGVFSSSSFLSLSFLPSFFFALRERDGFER